MTSIILPDGTILWIETTDEPRTDNTESIPQNI